MTQRILEFHKYLIIKDFQICYIVRGALDIGLLNERLADRQIIAGRAVGVRTLQELMDAPLESVTYEAEKLGITPGLLGKDALIKML